MSKDMLIKEINEFAKYEGFKLGFVKFDNNDKILYEILKKRRLFENFTEFEESDIKKRSIEKEDVLKNAKSIVVGIFPYYTKTLDFESNLSVYNQVLDYHKVLKNKFEKLAELIGKREKNFEYKILVDASPLVERYIAQNAGLGFFGLNNSLINESYGSYFFIGTMIVNLEFEQEDIVKKDCLKCRRCIEICPGNAILDDFDMNPKKCLSYITQKKVIGEEEVSLIKENKKIFGCDLCQFVCPLNKNLSDTNISEFKENILTRLSLEDLLISNKVFKQNYSNRSFSWRGKNILLRNLKIIENIN